MYHMIIEVTDNRGCTTKHRKEYDYQPTVEDIEYEERYYIDRWSYPDNLNALVTNIYFTPEPEDD